MIMLTVMEENPTYLIAVITLLENMIVNITRMQASFVMENQAKVNI